MATEDTKIVRLNNWPNREELSDAELAARWAVEALEGGRLALGAALVDLARRAAHAEASPRRAPVQVAYAQQAAASMFGPGAERARDVPVVRPATLQEAQRSHAPQVCTYVQEIPVPTSADPDAVMTSPCHQPIGWSDGGTSARSGWYHLDGTITDHTART